MLPALIYIIVAIEVDILLPLVCWESTWCTGYHIKRVKFPFGQMYIDLRPG